MPISEGSKLRSAVDFPLPLSPIIRTGIPIAFLVNRVTEFILRLPLHGADIGVVIVWNQGAYHRPPASHIHTGAFARESAHIIASCHPCRGFSGPLPRRCAADCSRGGNRGRGTCRELSQHFYSEHRSQHCARRGSVRACMPRFLQVSSACPSYRKQRNACRDLASLHRRNTCATLVP